MRTYRLAPWARVRQEDFGLLFYDTRSTTMTFVRSGTSLRAPAAGEREGRLRLACGSEAEEARVARALEQLEGKGLVVAAEPE